MAEDEDQSLFIVRWFRPQRDATRIVLCESCGATLYSSPENIAAAFERKMRVACPACAAKLVKEHGGMLGGRIRHGKVIE